MTRQTKANILGLLTLILGICILIPLKKLWPEIILVLGTARALRQLVLGRHYDVVVTLAIFSIVFVTWAFNMLWGILISLPTIFVVAAALLLLRDFYVYREDKKRDAAVEALKQKKQQQDQPPKKHG